uniref:Uncharacterized protein n=1 Tax=Globodera rostochiensis TaxID=31243 RepID=A0A914I7W7_GLORO
MAVKLCRFALCVSVKDGACLMLYEDDLSAIEARPEFNGARMDTWYRFELKEDGDQSWKAVEKRLSSRRVERALKGGKRREAIQIYLPVFFIPNFAVFGCKWKRALTASQSAEERSEIELYSPRLKSAVKINVNAKRLIELGAREDEQCHAFLTLTVDQSGAALKPPQWSLDSVDDFKINADPLSIGLPGPSQLLPPHLLATTSKPTEWGILLRIEVDSNDKNRRLGVILCLRDGTSAYGRILPHTDGSLRAEKGDAVVFCSIKVDCFTEPVRVAFNVLSWSHHFLQDNLTEQFEDSCSLLGSHLSDPKYHLASTLAIESRECSEVDFWDLKRQNSSTDTVQEEDRKRFLPSQQQQQEQQLSEKNKHPLQEGVGVFTHSKGYMMFWRFYDERTERFTHLVSANKQKTTFPAVHPTLKPGVWFRIAYRKQKTPTTIEILAIRPETELGYLPPHVTDSQNWDVWVWEQMLDQKVEEVKIGN